MSEKTAISDDCEQTSSSASSVSSASSSLVDLTAVLRGGENTPPPGAPSPSLSLSPEEQQQQWAGKNPMYCTEDIDNDSRGDDLARSSGSGSGSSCVQLSPRQVLQRQLSCGGGGGDVVSAAREATLQGCVALAQDCLHEVLLSAAASPSPSPSAAASASASLALLSGERGVAAALSVENVFGNNQRLIAVLCTIFFREYNSFGDGNDGALRTGFGGCRSSTLNILKDFILSNIGLQVTQSGRDCKQAASQQQLLFKDLLSFAMGQLSLLSQKSPPCLPPVLGHTRVVAMHTTHPAPASSAAAASTGCDGYIQCQQGHAMTAIVPHERPVAYSQKGPSWYAVCDICSQSQLHTLGEDTYHCALCKFDCCQKCANARRVEAGLTAVLAATGTFSAKRGTT